MPDKRSGADPGESPAAETDFQRISARRLFAEALGTFLLTIVAAGGGVISAVNGGEPGKTAQVIAPGLLVMAMIYSLGKVSGAHLNPVVTLAFALRRDFPWHRVLGYCVAQLLGGTLAASLLYVLFGRHGSLGATLPHHGLGQSFVMELLLTFLLVTVILATAANASVVGPNAALAVGGTVALCGLFAEPISGASMNPARSFGPALIDQHLDTFWIYAAGPLAGAIFAVVVAWVLRGETNTDAEKAATGS